MKIKCSIYRGGTSRGVFFKKEDLPEENEKIEWIFKEAIDCFNQTSVDGLGGGISSTNKTCIVSKSLRDGVDLDWTFYQLGIGNDTIDSSGTCGNLIAAAAAFGVNEKMFNFDEKAEKISVNIFNTNISKIIKVDLFLENARAKESGDFKTAGLFKSSSPIDIAIQNAGGEKCKKTFLLGKTSELIYQNRAIKCTFCDLINPFVYVDSKDFSLIGNEDAQTISNNSILMAELNALRDKVCFQVGFVYDAKDAQKLSPAIPRIALVAPSQSYITSSGEKIEASEVDILVKMLSMGKLHKTSPASGLYNLAAAVCTNETLPNKITNKTYNDGTHYIKIGHLGGVATVRVTKENEKITGVGITRSARCIMKGEVYI